MTTCLSSCLAPGIFGKVTVKVSNVISVFFYDVGGGRRARSKVVKGEERGSKKSDKASVTSLTWSC